MELDILREYLLKKTGASEDFPFGPDVMVFKVMGKMFALVIFRETPLKLNLKCDPELSLHLRNIYTAVRPGYHMNKKHWNTVVLDGSIPGEEIFTMIDDSYGLVVKKLKSSDQKHLNLKRASQ